MYPSKDWTHLRKVFFGNPVGPFATYMQWSGRIGHICALDQHPLDDRKVFRTRLNVGQAETNTAGTAAVVRQLLLFLISAAAAAVATVTCLTLRAC